MWTLEPALIENISIATGNTFSGMLPLWGIVTGIFVSFAILNMLRFFLSRLIK